MKKLDTIRYILKHQKCIDASLIDDFQTYSKKELEAMKVKEVAVILANLMEAEDIMDNIPLSFQIW